MYAFVDIYGTKVEDRIHLVSSNTSFSSVINLPKGTTNMDSLSFPPSHSIFELTSPRDDSPREEQFDMMLLSFPYSNWESCG
jgi:hypothetical protein